VDKGDLKTMVGGEKKNGQYLGSDTKTQQKKKGYKYGFITRKLGKYI
jgi:hypothetical protein